MSKEQIVIVGVGITQTIIDQVKELYPNHEISVVEDIKDVKNYAALMLPEPMKITREDLIFPAELRMQDAKPYNPWPEPHHSSKKRRKY
jgi:hypothetical protein